MSKILSNFCDSFANCLRRTPAAFSLIFSPALQAAAKEEAAAVTAAGKKGGAERRGKKRPGAAATAADMGPSPAPPKRPKGKSQVRGERIEFFIFYWWVNTCTTVQEYQKSLKI